MFFLEPFFLIALSRATVVGKVQISPTKCQIDHLLRSGDIVTKTVNCNLKDES
jgi:hypothetical protein